MDGWNRIGATLPGSHPGSPTFSKARHISQIQKKRFQLSVEQVGASQIVTTPTTRCWLHLPTKLQISHDAPTQSFSWRL